MSDDNINDPIQIQEEMHRVLKKIYENGAPPIQRKSDKSHKTANDIIFELTNKDKEKASKLYSTQLKEMVCNI